MDIEKTKALEEEDKVYLCLPENVKNAQLEESKQSVEAIKQGLAWSVSISDYYRGCNYYTKKIDKHLKDFRYFLSNEDALWFANKLWSMITIPNLDLTLQAKWASTLTVLLKHHKHIDFSIHWRTLYDIINDSHYRETHDLQYAAVVTERNHLAQLLKLVFKAKRFFSKESTGEIIQFFTSTISPHDNSIFRSIAFLNVFLHVNKDTSFNFQAWIPQFLSIWNLVEQSDEFDRNCFEIISNIAYHLPGKLNWEPFIPIINSKYLNQLGVTLGNTNLPRPKSRKFPSEYNLFGSMQSTSSFFASIIVHSMHRSNSNLALLKKLMYSLDSYYHPSNNGEWVDSLSRLIVNLTSLYAKRIEKERVSNSKKFPENFRLSKEDDIEFIHIVLPAVIKHLYSKNDYVARYAYDALKCLTQINAKEVIPKMVEQLYLAFDNVTAAHRAHVAYEILGTLIADFVSTTEYPASEHIIPILEYVLNAINTNDSQSTQSAFKILFRFLSTVPLVRATGSSVGDSMQIDSDEIENRVPHTAYFGDFALQLLDRLFTLLSHKDKAEKGGSEWWMNLLMQSTFNLFFMQMSDEIFEEVSKKYFDHITNSFKLNALMEYCLLAESIGFANPTKALQLFIPSLFRQLINEKTKKLNDLSTDELKWKIRILASVIKYAGKSILAYKEKLITLFNAAAFHEEKKISRSASKIIQNLLMALTDIYPTDYRSLPPRLWNDKKTQYHKTWGQKYTYENLELSWHVPSKEEVDIANEIISQFIATATSTLNNSASQASKDDIYKVLKHLCGVVIGAATIMSVERDENGFNNKRGLAPLKSTPVHKGIDPNLINFTFRPQIQQLAHQVVEFLLASRPDDIVCMNAAIKLIKHGVSFYGAESGDLAFYSMFWSMLKEKYKNHMLRKSKADFRVMKIVAAHKVEMARVEASSRGLPFNDLHRKLLNDLWRLSTHTYSKVRGAAQGTLIELFQHIPGSLVEFLPTAIATLSQPKDESKPGVIKGGIYILNSKYIQHRIHRDWRLLDLFVQNLIRSYVHKEQSDQGRLYQLFVVSTVLYSNRSLSIQHNPGLVDASIPADQVTLGIKTLAHDNEKNLEHYKNIIKNILGVLREPDLHWRYQVIALASLTFTIRKDMPIEPEVVRIFFRALTSEISPIRILSQKAVSLIFENSIPRDQVTRSVTKVEKRLTVDNLMQLPAIQSESQWNSTEFFDINWLGWSSAVDLSTLRSTRTNVLVDNSASRKLVIEEFSNSLYVEKVLQLIASDHHSKAVQSRDTSRGYMSNFMMAARFHMGDMGGMGNIDEQGASEILSEFSRSRRTWPFSKTPILSAVFSESTAHFWRSLFRVSGVSILEVFKPALHALKLDELENQVILAELLGGLVRASKRWNFDQVKTMWNFVLPLVDKALQNTATETLPEWSTCLRFMSYNTDARRLQPLIDYLFSNPFSGSTSGTIMKKLLMIKSILNEVTWRSGQLDVALLKLIGDQLSHPFKQVRHAIGECLATIFFNISDPQGISTESSKILDSFVEHVIHKLDSWERDLSSDEKNERSRETILHWLSYSFTFSESSSCIKYIPTLLKYIFFMQRDSDDDIAKQAMQIPAIIAQTQMNSLSLNGILNSLLEVSKQTNWHVRSATLPFLQILTFVNKFNVTAEQQRGIAEFIIFHLSDPQIEIRELAKIALTSVVKSLNLDVNALTEQFYKIASSIPISKLKGNENNENIVKRHGAVLGLSALILSQPYDVNEHMPDLLVKAASFINDPQPIKLTVREAFADFWRTHQDSWSLLQTKFNPDQLSVISELVLSPNYYV